MVNEAESNAKVDEEVRKRVESKNALEAYLYNARTTSSSNEGVGGKLGKADKQKITGAVSEGLHWLSDHPDESIDVYEEKLKTIEAIVGPLLTGAYTSASK